MSVDIEVLVDMYKIIKEYIPSKERQAVADHVFSNIVDSCISEVELKEFCSEDKNLRRAFVDYMGDDDESDESE